MDFPSVDALRLTALLLISTFPTAYCQEHPTDVTSESNLRLVTKFITKPLYPPRAIHNRQTGVAVAQVHINVYGVVSKVDVLESPSVPIADSVRIALKQWKFSPGLVDANGELVGKLTYYFVFINQMPIVLEPKDAPYVGHWPMPSSSTSLNSLFK